MKTNSRRQFFKKVIFGISLLPLLKVSDSFAALAAACPQGMPKGADIKKKLLDYQGKAAKRLGFVANWKDGKNGKFKKKWKDNSNCANCKFNKEHKVEKQWGKCTMLGNKYVPSCGWCKSYKLDKKKAKKA